MQECKQFLGKSALVTGADRVWASTSPAGLPGTEQTSLWRISTLTRAVRPLTI